LGLRRDRRFGTVLDRTHRDRRPTVHRQAGGAR
jgi:hypothetical protein